MKIESRKGVEDILAEQGLLTPDQLSAIKFEHINTGKGTEAIILERGYVSSADLVRARATLLSIPFVELSGKTIPPTILDLVPEPVARKYRLIPFSRESGVLQVAMVDPLDLQVMEFLEKRAGVKVEPFIADLSDVEAAISDQYGKSLGTEVSAALEEVGGTTKIEEQIKDLNKAEETIRDAPVSRIVATLLEYAVKSRASDVHIESLEDRTRVRYRIDGVLQERITLPKKVHDSLVSRIKILSDLKIDEHRLPQDGRFKVQVGNTETDLRVSTLPTVYGEKVVIRLLKEKGKATSLADLGLGGTSLRKLEENLLRPYGIILITGPTGSGKTVTLASALSKISSIRVNIVTVEDPVEIMIPGANQVQVNPQAGLTFASGLRSILRQDPNIIMVGEIRDSETAQLAVQAALTGHLVFSTLHTNNSSAALPRLLDMDIEAYLLMSTINAIVAQRLVRIICANCKISYEAPEEVAQTIKSTLGILFDQKIKVKGNNGKITLYRGKGCEQCDHTGYIGRIGVFEVLVMSDEIGKLVLAHKPSSDIEKQAVDEGMSTLIQDGFLKVLDGITTVDEVMRVIHE